MTMLIYPLNFLRINQCSVRVKANFTLIEKWYEILFIVEATDSVLLLCPTPSPNLISLRCNSPSNCSSRTLFWSSPPPVMISGILIFNQKGENLIFRAFRNDCRPRLADVFRIQVISNAQVRSPILTLGSTTFSHVKHENIYLVAVTKSNANAALVFEFLYRLVALGKGYFGKFDEEAVKNNFVLVYELLDGTNLGESSV